MKSRSRTRNYLAGLCSGYVVTFATIVVGLWMTPFSLRFLDREEFAVFTLAGDVLIWLGLLEIGLTAVLNVKAAQQTGNPDQNLLNTLASTTFFAQCGIALVLLLAGGILTIFFPHFFYLRSDLHTVSMQVFGIMVIGAALNVASQTFTSLLVAHQQIHVDNLIRLLLISIRTGLTVVLLVSGYGLLSLALANFTAVLVTSILAFIRVRRLLPGLSLHWRHFSWVILREAAGTGIWFSLGGVAGIVIMHLDRIVTAKLVSVEMVTTLALTGKLYALTWSIVQQITNTARPALAQLIGQGEKQQSLLRYHQLSAVSSGSALLLAVACWAGNENFVNWWVGRQNYGGYVMNTFFLFNLIIHSWVLPNRAIISAGLIYVRQNTITRLIEGGINLVLSVVLGMLFGVKGILLATGVSGLITSCWYLPILTARYFNLEPAELVAKDLRKILSFLLVLMPIGFLGRMIANRLEGILGVVAVLSFCFIVGSFFFWNLILDRQLRTKVSSRFIPGFCRI